MEQTKKCRWIPREWSLTFVAVLRVLNRMLTSFWLHHTDISEWAINELISN